jgi:hypothetical protein
MRPAQRVVDKWGLANTEHNDARLVRLARVELLEGLIAEAGDYENAFVMARDLRNKLKEARTK